MSLTLVLGPANAAKAGEVLGAYALAARRDALLVLPTAADVAHYERELAAPGVTLGRPLTFPGLIDEIALRAGYRSIRLTAIQRERLLRRSIASLRLEALADSADGVGFARAAGRLITELQQARIDPERFSAGLQSWARTRRGSTAYARELASIHRRYMETVEALERVDAEGFAYGALDALRQRPDGWGMTPVFLYGFDDLTPIELDAVETLARLVDAPVTVSLTYEPGRPAFAARAGMVEELRPLAQAVRQLPAVQEHYEPASRAALHHLERHLFEADPPVIDPGDAVILLEAGGERAETELVAAEVLAALRAGAEPHELVIVCRSLGRRGEMFERALARVGVPAISARRVALGHTALGRALLGLTRYALLPGSKRDVEDLIAYLRHPGVVDRPDALDRFERQVRRDSGRIGEALRSRGPALRAAFAALEQLRLAPDRLTELITQTRNLLAAPHLGRGQTLEFEQELDARAAAAVFNAIEEVRQLQPAQSPPVDELIELLEGLQVAAHGVAVAGAVLIAEPLTIRARRFRRVFITGLCEGEFPGPQTAAADPFLGDERRRELALEGGVVLQQAADPLARERYLLYASVSRATERVTFSYRSSDEDGNVVIASPFLDDIAALFVPAWRERRARRLLADVTWSPEQAPTAREHAVAVAFAQSSSAHRLVGAGGQRAAGPAVTRVLSDQALSHVRHRQLVSANALEAFAACPVRWLVERQLNPERLEPDQLALTRGSFVHAVLERVFARLGAALTADTLEAAERLLHDEMRGPAAAEPRAKLAADQPAEVRAAVLRGIEADLRRYLRAEASDGCTWPPLATELRFGLDGDIDGALPAVELGGPDQSLLLSGIVDRVDVDPDDGARVIVRDYKSGARRDGWPGARWVSDLQIQVALYMLAVERLLGRQVVAGFYQPLRGDDLRPRGVYAEGAPVGERVVVRDERSQHELDALLDEIEQEAVAIAGRLQRGELTPCPESCSPDGLCSYPGICWGT